VQELDGALDQRDRDRLGSVRPGAALQIVCASQCAETTARRGIDREPIAEFGTKSLEVHE
jgi:hypothetical protein